MVYAMKEMKQEIEKKNELKKLIQEKYSLVTELVIFGAPGRKSNARIFTGSSWILGKSAQAYKNIFFKQIKRFKIPYQLNDRDFLWVFEIWYSDMRSDASTELIFDLMEETEIIKNDVTLRNYVVLANCIDKQLPRTIISIYKEKNHE